MGEREKQDTVLRAWMNIQIYGGRVSSYSKSQLAYVASSAAVELGYRLTYEEAHEIAGRLSRTV